MKMFVKTINSIDIIITCCANYLFRHIPHLQSEADRQEHSKELSRVVKAKDAIINDLREGNLLLQSRLPGPQVCCSAEEFCR